MKSATIAYSLQQAVRSADIRTTLSGNDCEHLSRTSSDQMFNTIYGDPEEIYGFKARLWARVVVGDVDCGHTRGARTTGPHIRPTRPDIHRLPCQLIVEVIRWWIRTLVRSLQTRRHPCQPRPGVLACSLAHLPILYSWQTSFLQISKLFNSVRRDSKQKNPFELGFPDGIYFVRERATGSVVDLKQITQF